MKAILIQPPFTQLNTPYPAIHYLEAFLRARGDSAHAFDHSIMLYRRIFSRDGMTKVFSDARAAMRMDRRACGHPDGRTNKRTDEHIDKHIDMHIDGPIDEATRLQIERYFSYERLYIEWIDGLVDFLGGRDPGMAHRLASAVELPRGARAEAFLAARDGRISPDEAKALATQILDDLGDFIAYALDPSFGTVRYAERIASSRASFGEVLRLLDSSWLVREFYGPMLEEFWSTRAAEAESRNEPIDYILVTIPFPGCLVGALACARAARKCWGGRGDPYRRRPRIIFGGGYVSTELRGLCDVAIFDFCDYLSFDAGYGSLSSIFDREERRLRDDGLAIGKRDGRDESAGHDRSPEAKPENSAEENKAEPDALYKTMTRGVDGTILVQGFPCEDVARENCGNDEASATTGSAPQNSARLRPTDAIGVGIGAGAPETCAERRALPCRDYAHWLRAESESIASVFPDYRDADFEAYLGVVDSENPMHRLWSDTPWLKFNLAHGCYWHRCTFCDTELEYVRDFVQSDMGALLSAADSASERSGLTGIHFVDEAMPMAALLDFSRTNRARQLSGRRRPFSFWGNVRFDASWTQGRCEFLAASGLVAVSGGIEIATERGLTMTDKGFDLASLVRALLAMRRAGLLVHTYLIYGFPGQSESDIVDSAEFCRQLFASGLVDSAFWHRFVLTRHSRMYREWREGRRPALAPVDKPWSFANNDLSFEGTSFFDKFDAPLAASLDAWMEGNGLDTPVSQWFGKKAPHTSLAPDMVESLIAKAEQELDRTIPQPASEAHWIAGTPILKPLAGGRATLVWAYRGEVQSLELPQQKARSVGETLSSAALGVDGVPYASLAADLALPPDAMSTLRATGLVLV